MLFGGVVVANLVAERCNAREREGQKERDGETQSLSIFS